MLFWIIALAAVAADGASKLTASALLQESTVKWGSLIHFRLTHNTGMALGILKDHAIAGIVLPLTAIVCGWLMMRRYRITRYTAIACGMIVGGFVGNFGERLIRGAVLDMIYFPWLPWFVCNVADIFICFGVAMLAFSLLFRADDWQEKEGTNNAKD